MRTQLLAISPAQFDRLLRPSSPPGPGHDQAGLALRTRGGPPDTSTPSHIEADTVAHCGDTTAGDFVYSLTFTDLCSGWTENRAVGNKGTQGILEQLKNLQA